MHSGNIKYGPAHLRDVDDVDERMPQNLGERCTNAPHAQHEGAQHGNAQQWHKQVHHTPSTKERSTGIHRKGTHSTEYAQQGNAQQSHGMRARCAAAASGARGLAAPSPSISGPPRRLCITERDVAPTSRPAAPGAPRHGSGRTILHAPSSRDSEQHEHTQHEHRGHKRTAQGPHSARAHTSGPRKSRRCASIQAYFLTGFLFTAAVPPARARERC